MFIRALFGSFHTNAMAASTSLMVPKEQLTRVQGLNQMLQGGLSIVAAPLGALLLALLPLQGILMIDVATAAFAILPLLLISIPEIAQRGESAPSERASSFWEDFRSGLRYVWSWPGLMLLLVMMPTNFRFGIVVICSAR